MEQIHETLNSSRAAGTFENDRVYRITMLTAFNPSDRHKDLCPHVSSLVKSPAERLGLSMSAIQKSIALEVDSQVAEPLHAHQHVTCVLQSGLVILIYFERVYVPEKQYFANEIEVI